MAETFTFPKSDCDITIELYSLDGKHQLCFSVDHYATIGQITKKLQQAAFDKYESNDVFESYKNSVILFTSPDGKPIKFNLWESDVQLMSSRELSEFRTHDNTKPLHFQLIRWHSPEWKNPWKGKTSEWMEAGNYLQEALHMCTHIKTDTRKLHHFGNTKKKLRDIPWNDIAAEIADNVNRTTELLDSAQTIMDMTTLRTFIQEWKNESDVVKKLLHWELFKESDAPAKNVAVLSRPGAYLADFMFTLVSIERQNIIDKVKYSVICNGVYKEMATSLDIHHSVYSNANNVGNIMESLVWLAYEQQKYGFIISVVHHAADMQLERNVHLFSAPRDLNAQARMGLRNKTLTLTHARPNSDSPGVIGTDDNTDVIHRRADTVVSPSVVLNQDDDNREEQLVHACGECGYERTL